MPKPPSVERRSASLNSTSLLLVRYFIAFLNGDVEDMKRKAALARSKPLHGGHDFARGGAGPGSLRPIAGGETDVRRRRRHRAAVWSARTGGLVRRGNGGVGSVLRERGRSQTEGDHGARPRQGPRRGLCGRVRAGPLRRRGSIAGSCRRPREELSRGYVGAIPVSADASGPVLIERARCGRRDSRAADRLALRPRPGRHRLHRTVRRPLSHLRSRPGVPRGAVSPPKPPPSSSGFSIIEASCSSIPWTRWRACSWRERSRSRATP